MKSYNELKASLDDILSQSRYDDVTKAPLPNRVLAPRRKKVRFLTVCVQYLKSNPSEDFLLKELKRLEHRHSEIDKQYPIGQKFVTDKAEKEFKKEFNKKWDIPKLKEQIKAVRFLLK